MDCKAHYLCIAMRTVINDCSHKFPYQKEILS
ncbi:hypothetical protein HDE71_004819 [Janthinobacterium sp. S3M3]|nr:hypothetical protein [Janthinobacterium sp. S3T4]MBB5615755.1 hypothetical protein [Janthinobacterium sp. S3M3]